MKNVGVAEPGRNARRMLELDAPSLDWCTLRRGMGVEAERADTVEGFAQAAGARPAARGPCVIEAPI